MLTTNLNLYTAKNPARPIYICQCSKLPWINCRHVQSHTSDPPPTNQYLSPLWSFCHLLQKKLDLLPWNKLQMKGCFTKPFVCLCLEFSPSPKQAKQQPTKCKIESSKPSSNEYTQTGSHSQLFSIIQTGWYKIQFLWSYIPSGQRGGSVYFENSRALTLIHTVNPPLILWSQAECLSSYWDYPQTQSKCLFHCK